MNAPILASQTDADQLVTLLCSASSEIKLKQSVCSPDKRPALLDWMKRQCNARRVWMLTEAASVRAMLILEESLILYVVVAEPHQGLGSALIHHVQTFSNALRAEARNDDSRRLLERCGFRDSGERSQYGCPMFYWNPR